MNRFDMYIWLSLCVFIALAELYFPYRIHLFSSFFISSAVCFVVAIAAHSLPLQALLFIILSFLSYVTITAVFKKRAKGKRSGVQKAIALCKIESDRFGQVYLDGKVIKIHNSGAETIECGEVVTLIKD